MGKLQFLKLTDVFMKDFSMEFWGILTSIVCVALGACLSYIFFRKQNQDKLSVSLFTKYQNIAQELAGILKDLLPLSLTIQNYTTIQCNRIDKALGEFLYKYYLILPPPVLEEINCLHECLLCRGKNAFIIKTENELPVLQKRSTDEEIKSLLEEVAIVTTKKGLFNIYKQYKRLPRSIYLKCHARHVIKVLNDCWNLSDIHEWKNKLHKKTIAQRRDMH